MIVYCALNLLRIRRRHHKSLNHLAIRPWKQKDEYKGIQSLLSLCLLSGGIHKKGHSMGWLGKLELRKKKGKGRETFLGGGLGLLMCENVMNIALIANHGQVNVLSANTTILRRLTMMNDNCWPGRRHRVNGKTGRGHLAN